MKRFVVVEVDSTCDLIDYFSLRYSWADGVNKAEITGRDKVLEFFNRISMILTFLVVSFLTLSVYLIGDFLWFVAGVSFTTLFTIFILSGLSKEVEDKRIYNKILGF